MRVRERRVAELRLAASLPWINHRDSIHVSTSWNQFWKRKVYLFTFLFISVVGSPLHTLALLAAESSNSLVCLWSYWLHLLLDQANTELKPSDGFKAKLFIWDIEFTDPRSLDLNISHQGTNTFASSHVFKKPKNNFCSIMVLAMVFIIEHDGEAAEGTTDNKRIAWKATLIACPCISCLVKLFLEFCMLLFRFLLLLLLIAPRFEISFQGFQQDLRSLWFTAVIRRELVTISPFEWSLGCAELNNDRTKIEKLVMLRDFISEEERASILKSLT